DCVLVPERIVGQHAILPRSQALPGNGLLRGSASPDVTLAENVAFIPGRGREAEPRTLAFPGSAWPRGHYRYYSKSLSVRTRRRIRNACAGTTCGFSST